MSYRRITLLATPLLAMSFAACDDGFGPVAWDATPDTIVLHSLARPELIGQPAAYDAVQLRTVIVERPGEADQWDVAVTEEGDALQLLPAGALDGLTVDPGIHVVPNATLADVERATGDRDAYVETEPVPLETGDVYVVRSRIYSRACRRYTKLELVEHDAAAGTATLAVVTNPNCSDRSFIPPDED